jgi:sec-independent protein translocase protein TatA
MGGLGLPELLVICVVALLVFGPKRLPDAGKALGDAIRGFKRSMEGKDTPAVPPPAAASDRTCAACAKPVAADATFCPHCGKPLDQAAA